MAAPSLAPRRSKARVVFVAGLVLVAASVVAYAAVTASAERADLVAAGPVQVVGGEARLTYLLPQGTSLVDPDGVLMGSYRFPDRGDVYVLGCVQHERFLAGAPLPVGAVALKGVKDGMFHERAERFLDDGASASCTSDVVVVLAWDAKSEWRGNPPSAVVELVQNPEMSGALPLVLFAGAAVGGVGSVAGGVAWRRERRGGA